MNVSTIIKENTMKHKLLSLSILIILPLSVLTSLLPPLLLGNVIDALADNKSTSISLALLYFLSFALSLALDSLRELMLVRYSEALIHTLRSELLFKLERLQVKDLESEDSGSRTALLEGDTENVNALFTSGVLSMASDALKVIGILFVIMKKSPALFVILIFILPLIYIYSRHIQKKMKESQLRNRREIAKASGFIPEAIENLRTIKNLFAEHFIKERYSKFIDESYRCMEKNNFYNSVFSPSIGVISSLLIAFVMSAAGSRNPMIISLFSITTGGSVTLINYITNIFSPIESIGMEIQTVQGAIASANRINTFLALDDRIIPTEEPKQIDDTAISFKDVDFSYIESKKVLSKLSFEIKRGEHITFTGRTGAGKSTIFKLILGEYKPQSGSVKVFSTEASAIKDSLKREIFGIVEQDFKRIDGTIYDEVALYDDAITEEDALYALELVGLKSTVDALKDGIHTKYTPSLFSHGQIQLLSIARAIAKKPPILLLDEITAALDAETERMVLTALDKASEGRTVLSISHRVYLTKGTREISIS